MDGTKSAKQTLPEGPDLSTAPVPIDVSYVRGDAWGADSDARLRWLRENDPVYWSEADNIWIITRYDDVSYVSRNQEIFTSAKGVRPGAPVRTGLLDDAEPRHGMLRRMLNKGFTPRMVRKLEETFSLLVTETLDRVACKGECDFVTDISVPLPLLVIAEMLGIAKNRRDDFHRWSDTMIEAEGNLDNPEVLQRAGEAFLEYSTYLKDIIADRRQRPRDDLVSILVNADTEGTLQTSDDAQAAGFDANAAFAINDEHAALATNDLIMLMTLLLIAGNETTRNAMSGGMALLIEHPAAKQQLIDDPDLIPGAVEEILRLVSPVRNFSRTVTQDTVLGGKKLRAGDVVLLCYSSANRDAKEFPNPDTFDIARNPNHLAFGIGSHFCLGASLARMELRVAFTHLLRRFPDMQYAGDGPVVLNNPFVRCCTEMRVRFTPEPSATQSQQTA